MLDGASSDAWAALIQFQALMKFVSCHDERQQLVYGARREDAVIFVTISRRCFSDVREEVSATNLTEVLYGVMAGSMSVQPQVYYKETG